MAAQHCLQRGLWRWASEDAPQRGQDEGKKRFYLGTIGLFLTLFWIFIGVLPMISIFEMRELVHKTEHKDTPVPAR